MIRIMKSEDSKQPFYVLNTGLNGEVLRVSELFKKKQKCYKNILADIQANYRGCKKVRIWDDTVPRSEPFYGTLEELAKKAGVELLAKASIKIPAKKV